MVWAFAEVEWIYTVTKAGRLLWFWLASNIRTVQSLEGILVVVVIVLQKGVFPAE